MRTMPGDRLWTPTWVNPAAARSSASDALSCVSADFVLLCVHAVFDNCADQQEPQRIETLIRVARALCRPSHHESGIARHVGTDHGAVG